MAAPITRVEIALQVDEVDESRGDGPEAGTQFLEGRAQLGDAEIGDCEGAGKLDHWGREL